MCTRLLKVGDFRKIVGLDCEFVLFFDAPEDVLTTRLLKRAWILPIDIRIPLKTFGLHYLKLCHFRWRDLWPGGR